MDSLYTMQRGVHASYAACINMSIMCDLQPVVLACSIFHYETPFATPAEFSEEEIADYLLAGYDMVKEARYKILVAHCPPYQTAIDRIHAGYHVGSHSVRTFIETISLTSVSQATSMRLRVRTASARLTSSILVCSPRADT